MAAVLALAACGQQGADGYVFGARQFDRGTVTVAVVEHPSEAALRAEARRLGVGAGGGRELMAFGFVSPDRPACTIHIVDPAKDYRPEWIGHELTHCLHGQWHEGQG
jgi:hypothetical protein